MRGNRCCGCLQRKLTRPQQAPPGARLTASWRQAVWGPWRPGIHGGRRTRRRPATPACCQADASAAGCAWWQGQAGPRRRPEGVFSGLRSAWSVAAPCDGLVAVGRVRRSLLALSPRAAEAACGGTPSQGRLHCVVSATPGLRAPGSATHATWNLSSRFGQEGGSDASSLRVRRRIGSLKVVSHPLQNKGL